MKIFRMCGIDKKKKLGHFNQKTKVIQKMIFPPFCFILHLYPTKQLFVMKAQDGGEGGMG